MNSNIKVGIEALAFDVPKIYLPIKELAIARNIEPEKLEKGLGLLKMALPDVHQDVVVLATNSVEKLIQQENLSLKDIARIYVGTESSVDAAKPVASYICSNLEQKFGLGSLEHCDAVDATFACVGGVDVFQNCLDFIRVNPTQKAIVVCTDFAKYDLNSTGEYTQGAGAVALLISADPKIMSIENHFAVSMQGVFDFFKPKREFSKQEITGKEGNPEWFGVLENEVGIAKDQPVFDGQYSNTCYQERTKNAYFKLKNLLNFEGSLYQNWKNIILHLPYSFQGRRMFSEIYSLDSELKNTLPEFDTKEYHDAIKAIGKTEEYRKFANERFTPAEVASSEIGNMYTGSIFMALLSSLYYHFENNTDLQGEKFGFLAYGSGSKSKAFEGKIENDWKSQIAKTHLFEVLKERKAINIETYHKIHKKEWKDSVLKVEKEWILERIEKENPVLYGARYYKYIE